MFTISAHSLQELLGIQFGVVLSRRPGEARLPQDRLITRKQVAAMDPPCGLNTVKRAEDSGDLTPVTRGGRRGKGIPVFYRESEAKAWKNGGLVLLVLVGVFAVLRLVAALGFDPARDAVTWMNERHVPLCVKGRWHHRHHNHSPAGLFSERGRIAARKRRYGEPARWRPWVRRNGLRRYFVRPPAPGSTTPRFSPRSPASHRSNLARPPPAVSQTVGQEGRNLVPNLVPRGAERA